MIEERAADEVTSVMVSIGPSRDADLLARASRALYARGWMEGTAGNLSVRLADGEHILITASGFSKGELTAANTVAIALDTGRLAHDGYLKASAETSIHLALYRAFVDCGAVVHAHPPYSTALASLIADDGAKVARFEKFEIIKGLGLPHPERVDIPVFQNWTRVLDIAADVERNFAITTPDTPPALLIAHHGATTWGDDIQQAQNRLECLEALCRLQLIVHRQGHPAG